MISVKESLAESYGLQDAMVEEMGVGQGQTPRFRVRTGEEQFIAKSLSPQSAQELYFESMLLDHLAEAEISVPTIIRTASGGVSTVWQERALVLYRWMEGYIQWPTTGANARRLGESVASMHLASDMMKLTGQERTYDLNRLVDRPMRLLERFAASSAQFSQLTALVQPLREKIAAVPSSGPAFGPIHGDLHQGNCAFQDDGSLAIFDFALCGVGYRMYDLTGYLWPIRDRTIDDPAMDNCCRSFLDGYRSVRVMTPEEDSSVVAFVHVRTLWETGDWIETGTGGDQPADVVKAIDYMIEHFGKADL